MAGCEGICDGLPGVAQPTICQEVNRNTFTHSCVVYSHIKVSLTVKTVTENLVWIGSKANSFL